MTLYCWYVVKNKHVCTEHFSQSKSFRFSFLFAFKSQYIVLEGVTQNLRMINGRFKTISGHFSVTTWISFTKLKSFWDTKGVYILFGSKVKKKWNGKCKNAKNTKELSRLVFFTKSQKSGNGNICVLCNN